MNIQLAEELKEKKELGTTTIDDIPKWLELSTEYCRESKDVQEEIENFSCIANWRIEGGLNLWLKIENGEFTWGEGTKEDANIIMGFKDKTNAIGMFIGELDPTRLFMEQKMSIEGTMNDAMKIKAIMDWFYDAFELI
jgi:hypothetical protein